MPEVTQVDLDSFSFITAGPLRMSLFVDNFPNSLLLLPKFYWSGIYGEPSFWEWKSVTGSREDNRWGYISLSPVQGRRYFYPGNRGDYYVCKFGYLDLDAGDFSIDEDEGWVEVWVYTGSATSDPSAYVYDSDGGFYYVDLAIDGYVISRPSLD